MTAQEWINFSEFLKLTFNTKAFKEWQVIFEEEDNTAIIVNKRQRVYYFNAIELRDKMKEELDKTLNHAIKGGYDSDNEVKEIALFVCERILPYFSSSTSYISQIMRSEIK